LPIQLRVLAELKVLPPHHKVMKVKAFQYVVLLLALI
jgi:hypothetical protein